jgi:hypothetical protein
MEWIRIRREAPVSQDSVTRMRELTLKVVWPDGRDVLVNIAIAPMIDRLDRQITTEAVSDDGPRYHLSSVELVSLSALQSFLRRITRGLPAGGTVRALILEPRLPDLYGVLNVAGEPVQPVKVELPNE